MWIGCIRKIRVYPHIKALQIAPKPRSPLLDETAELLREFGFARWSEWFAIDAKRIRLLDIFGIEHLLTAFGGMGSFNDVVLHSRNEDGSAGHALHAENEKLDSLRTSIYNLANKLANEERG